MIFPFLPLSRIILEFSDQVRSEILNLYKISESLAYIDLFSGMAEYAKEFQAGTNIKFLITVVIPSFGNIMFIKDGKHPILLRNLNGHVISNDIESNDIVNFNVITGSNMSGKSTILRQVCLFQIMVFLILFDFSLFFFLIFLSKFSFFIPFYHYDYYSSPNVAFIFRQLK